MTKKERAAITRALFEARPYNTEDQRAEQKRAGQSKGIYWITIVWENHVCDMARAVTGAIYHTEGRKFLNECGYPIDSEPWNHTA